MQEDTLKYDSLDLRPLPRWLINQKEGLTTYKSREIIIRDDPSLKVSVAVTGLIVLISVVLITVWIKSKNRNKQV